MHDMSPRARFIEMLRAHPIRVPIKLSDYGLTRKELNRQLHIAKIEHSSWIKRRTKIIEPTFIYAFKTEAMCQRFKNHLNSLFGA